MTRLSSEYLLFLCNKALEETGLNESDAHKVSQALVSNSLRSLETHGVRLLETYVKELIGGRSNISPNYKVTANSPAALFMDADDGLGILASLHALETLELEAKKFGISCMCVANSNHFGAASTYTQLMAKKGFISFAFSNSDALVVPQNGNEVKLGTNPLSFAAPMADDDVFCVDIATSQSSFSFVKSVLDKKGALATGLAIGSNFEDSSKTGDFYGLSPLGGYKGQGLGMLISVLCSVLSGMPFDSKLTHLYTEPYDSGRQIGHFFILIDIDAFINLEHFKQRCYEFCMDVKGSQSDVFWPGEIEKEQEKVNKELGIQLHEPEKTYFSQLASKYGSNEISV